MKKINKILVIRFRRVGDAVLSTAVCSSLKKSFPDASIDYVLNENIAPLFQNHPDIDNIIKFSDNDMSIFNYIRKVRRITKSGKYDMIVDTRSTIKTLWFCLFSMKTQYRLGIKKKYNFFIQNYRTSNKHCIDKIDVLLSILKPLENKSSVIYDRNFRVYPSKEEISAFSDHLSNNGVDVNKPIIICAVATRLSYKMWNQESMKEILNLILDRYKDVQLIFNYAGKEEKNIAQTLHHDMLQSHPRIFSNVEANNLRELAAMVKLSSFFFGNEGGPRHISQALNIPSFAIYPPNISKQTWLPNPNERFQGLEPRDISYEKAISKISYNEKFNLVSVEEVWKLLHPMLENYLK